MIYRGDTMNLDDFLEEQKKIEKLPIDAQKKFYEKLLNKKHDKTELYMLGSPTENYIIKREALEGR